MMMSWSWPDSQCSLVFETSQVVPVAVVERAGHSSRPLHRCQIEIDCTASLSPQANDRCCVRQATNYGGRRMARWWRRASSSLGARQGQTPRTSGGECSDQAQHQAAHPLNPSFFLILDCYLPSSFTTRTSFLVLSCPPSSFTGHTNPLPSLIISLAAACKSLRATRPTHHLQLLSQPSDPRLPHQGPLPHSFFITSHFFPI